MLQKCAQKLSLLFHKSYVDSTHGIDHALKVVEHCRQALICHHHKVDQQIVLLAALFHDADDRKYFPHNSNYENMRQILTSQGASQDTITKVADIISSISFSKNGDSIDQTEPEHFYYPRYADRLQAIGLRGIVRCYEYNLERKMPLYVPSTVKPHNQEELKKQSSGRNEIYSQRGGTSESMIDHLLDKLIHVGLPKEIKNKYLSKQFQEKKEDVGRFILRHSPSNYVNAEKEIKQLQKQYS